MYTESTMWWRLQHHSHWKEWHWKEWSHSKMGCKPILERLCLLPPVYVVRGKVLFSQVSVCPHLGGYLPSGVRGVPTFPGLEGGTYLPRSGQGGYLPSQVWGVPTWVPPHQVRYPPPPEQHGVHLLRGGRYASCVHAGGLSCFHWF